MYQDNLSLGVSATYRLEFITVGKIGKDGSITVFWPPQVTITDKVNVLVTSNGKATVKPQFVLASRKMIIKGAFAG